VDREIVRLVNAIPLPKGDQPESWLVDLTPPRWLRKTWPTRSCPYRYTVPGTYLRLAMASNKVRLPKSLDRLTDHVHRWQGEVHEAMNMAQEWDDRILALLVIEQAVFEEGSPFIIIRSCPDGITDWWGNAVANGAGEGQPFAWARHPAAGDR